MMYFKDRDADIMRFVREYGSITISQAAKIFFNHSNNKYDLARKRLMILYKNSYLKRYQAEISKQAVYYLDKPLKDHSLKLLDVYAELSAFSRIVSFIREYSIENHRCDGYFQIETEDEDYIYNFNVLVEIDQSHETSVTKIKNIIAGNKFETDPILIIVQRNDFMKKYSFENLKYVSWNQLETIKEVFI